MRACWNCEGRQGKGYSIACRRALQQGRPSRANVAQVLRKQDRHSAAKVAQLRTMKACLSAPLLACFRDASDREQDDQHAMPAKLRMALSPQRAFGAQLARVNRSLEPVCVHTLWHSENTRPQASLVPWESSLPSTIEQADTSLQIQMKCMYVCMYVRMNVCVCLYHNVCVYVCMYVCMYVRTYVCMYVCMYGLCDSERTSCQELLAREQLVGLRALKRNSWHLEGYRDQNSCLLIAWGAGKCQQRDDQCV